MKHRSKLLLSLFLFSLLILAACGQPSVTPPAVSVPSSSTPVEEVPSEPQQPETSILDRRQALGEGIVLWYIPNDCVEQGLQQKVLSYQDGLLLWGTTSGEDGNAALRLAILSLETGEICQEAFLSGFDIPDVQVCGSLIAVTDWMDGDVRLLDSTLCVTQEYQAQTQSCTIYLDPKAEKVYTFTQNDGVQITDMATGSTKVLLEGALSLFPSSRCGNAVTVSYTDPDSQLSTQAVVDLSRGLAEEIPFTGAFYGVGYTDGLWLTGILGEDNAYYLGISARPHTFTAPGTNTMVSLLNGPTRLLATSYDESGAAAMTLYDAGGSFLSSCNLPAGLFGPYYDPVWCQADGGYYFTVTDETGKDLLLFWDLSTPVAGENLQLTAAYNNQILPGTAVSQSLYDRAAKISETYGINVKIGEQVLTAIYDFTVAQELDEASISSALDALETALASYPDGFIAQLPYSDQRTIEFHLAGQLTKDGDEGATFTSFSGFASEQEGKNVVVVDITLPDSLVQVLYHEIAHMIDFKLAFNANLRDKVLYSESGWSSLNPDDFRYAESMTLLPEHFNDGYEGWFVDLYSRTNALEDRATILEHAMMGDDWVFSASPGRLAKLDYLCRCIRDCFDTTLWPETTAWEKTLKNCK